MIVPERKVSMRAKKISLPAARFGLRRRIFFVQSQRGGMAATEFAIVLPVLVTLFLGATDFGRVSYSTIAIANAARGGAAYASMNPYDPSTQSAWTAGINQAVADELSQSSAFDTSKLTITITRTVESGGLSRVAVQVTYPFKTLIPWSFVPSSITLQETAVMRCIRE